MNDTNTAAWPRGVVFGDGDDWEDGAPGVDLVASAIQVWSSFQPGPTTVRQAGEAFNLDDAQVRQAVEAHYWMFLSGTDDDPINQTIEHEGE